MRRSKKNKWFLLFGSMETENIQPETATEEKVKDIDLTQNNLSNLEIMEKNGNNQKKKKKKFNFIPKFGCLKLKDDFPAAEMAAAGKGFNMEADCNGRDHTPTHLVVMVNGIIGSAQNWRYAAKQFVKAYPNDVIVHCSESNYSTLTFDGVDIMGKRLADEVISVVSRHPNLQKISFVGHSLGGLIARYAVAVLYQRHLIPKDEDEKGKYVGEKIHRASLDEITKGNIAGLEPMNFLTFATPHLGCRGHKQVPVFCGFHTMEKLATRVSWLLGRTGKHLFLSDCDDGKPPLLLRMSSDAEDLKFISALESFKRRVAYANARFDYLVGWSSSSLRRRSELPKRRSLLKNAKYPHVVNEEKSTKVGPLEEVSLEVKVGKGRTRDMEETMIRGLTRLNWERVDVNFSGSIQRLLAHSTIQVKSECLNSDGADVTQHMMDEFLL